MVVTKNEIHMASDGDQSLYKVLVIGDYAGFFLLWKRRNVLLKFFFLIFIAVGKTSLIKQYVDGVFTPNYKLTIGVDFAVKVLFLFLFFEK